MVSPLDNEAGRYIVGGNSRPVTRRIYQEVLKQFKAGNGVTAIRNNLRLLAKDNPEYKTSNEGVTGIVRELKEIEGKRNVTARIGNRRRPGKTSIVKSGMRFGSRYRYFGEIHLWIRPEGEYEEGVFGDDSVLDGDRENGEPYDIVPVYFSSDELLTMEEIKSRLEGMGQSIALKGGINRRDYQSGLYVHHVEVKSVQESAK